MKRTETVEEYIEKHQNWRQELHRLRTIVLSTGLEESIKWGAPCYTLAGKNVVGIGAFKSYFGLWFFQGALLEDDGGFLINAQEGKTKAMRQWRMIGKRDIKAVDIKRYIKAAAALVQDGKEIKPDRAKPIVVPKELGDALRERRAAEAFQSLRPGQRREYADYVTEAKRDDTKRRRVDKILPMILEGVGLNDKYR